MSIHYQYKSYLILGFILLLVKTVIVHFEQDKSSILMTEYLDGTLNSLFIMLYWVRVELGIVGH